MIRSRCFLVAGIAWAVALACGAVAAPSPAANRPGSAASQSTPQFLPTPKPVPGAHKNAAPAVAKPPVLVINATGLNDVKPGAHAKRFSDPLLPDAKVYVVGMHGKLKADGKRVGAGYDHILRDDTGAKMARSAMELYKLASTGKRTVLAMDINESWVPKQGPRIDDKTAGPAWIAAEAVIRWKKDNPDGVVILRGHSDGTWVVSNMLDHLAASNVWVDVVVAESPRPGFRKWHEQTVTAPRTQFIFVTADMDFFRAPIVDRGFAHMDRPNVTLYNIKGRLNSFAAHGDVTELSKTQRIERIDIHGKSEARMGSLADGLRRDLAPILAGQSTASSGKSTLATTPPAQSALPRRRDEKLPHKAASLNDYPPPPPPPPPPARQVAAPTPLGGVDATPPPLAAHAKPLPRVTAAVVDPQSGRLIVLTEGGNALDIGVDKTTFALALYVTYRGQRLAFSLDPDDPAHPEGEWLKAVYYPKETAGLAAQHDMYLADVKLKMAAFKVMQVGDRFQERQGGLLQSLPEMMFKVGSAHQSNQWARMWIVANQVELAHSNGVVRVDLVKMGVKAKRQVPDATSLTGLRDVDTDPASIEARFARSATEKFDQMAHTIGEAPEWARVTELTKALAIAAWLQRSGVRVDMQELARVLNENRAPAVSKMRALDLTFHHEEIKPINDGQRRGTVTHKRSVRIFGGVDPQASPRMTEDPSTLPLRRAVLAALPAGAASAAQPFAVRHGQQQFIATPLPFSIVFGKPETQVAPVFSRWFGPRPGPDAGCRKPPTVAARC